MSARTIRGRALFEDGGSLAATTVLMLPVLLTVLAGVTDLGLARLVAERARMAADLAAVVAANDQDPDELARTGRLVLRADAARVAREHFTWNLEALAGSLAESPEAIAASAAVEAFGEPGGTDPLSGRVYDRPTVRISARVPVRTPVLGALILRPVTSIEIFAASSPR